MSELESLREDLRALEEEICDAEAQEYGSGRAAADIARTIAEIQEEIDSIVAQRAECALEDPIDLLLWRRLVFQEEAAEDKQIERDAYLSVAEGAKEKVVVLRKQHRVIKDKLAEWGQVLVFSLVKSDANSDT